VVNAVRCTVEEKTTMADRTADLRIAFRIGIDIGDIIVEGDDIFGDAVNVAARLEAEAERQRARAPLREKVQRE
jgi:adenylate cyclase